MLSIGVMIERVEVVVVLVVVLVVVVIISMAVLYVYIQVMDEIRRETEKKIARSSSHKQKSLKE